MIIEEFIEILLQQTKSIVNDDHQHDIYHYALNPSIMHWKKNLYIIVYRSITYKIHKKKNTALLKMHPWKIWDNGYKYFFPDPERMYYHDPFHYKKGNWCKYRDNEKCMEDFFLTFPCKTDYFLDMEGETEIDNTSLAIMSYDPEDDIKWKIVHWHPNIFGKYFNQDARLHKYHDEMLISYNVYYKNQQNKDVVRLYYRPFIILEEPTILYFFEERNMICPKIASRIEKNCIFVQNNVLHNVFSGEVVFQKKDESVLCQVSDNSLWKKIFMSSREYNAIFSLGTNTIPFRENTMLMAGHVKIPYKELKEMSSVSGKKWLEWLKSVSWFNIHSHGKFLYYMYFVEMTCDYKIIRCSHSFIPTSSKKSHLPYFLVFPSGLSYGRNKDEILLSYGEGDVRTKILSISRDNLENFLLYEHEFNINCFQKDEIFEYRFELLDIDEWNVRPRIFHFGYFYEKNAGDDQYILLFRLLQKRFASHSRCFFRNKLEHYQEKEVGPDDIVIFGGGDIINPYFINSLKYYLLHQSKYAISIGLPYLEKAEELNYFDVASLRNILDIHNIQSGSGRNELIQRLVSYPDIAFLIPMIRPLCYSHPQKEYINIGISFPRTWYKKDNKHYHQLVLNFSKVLKHLLENNKNMTLTFIPFCVNTLKISENDMILNNQFIKLLNDYHDRVYQFIPSSTPVHYVFDIDSEIQKKIDFMICGRFHAHIFCINRHVPFISMSSSRKCEQLMIELDHAHYLYSLSKDADDCPVFPENHIQNAILFIENAIFNIEHIKLHIQQFQQNNITPRLFSFLDFYQNLICPLQQESCS